MKSFKEILNEASPDKLPPNFTVKIGRRGLNGSTGWISFKNSGVRDRSLFPCDKDDIAYYGQANLKNVFRWYHNDNPPGHHDTTGHGGLVYIDVTDNTARLSDAEKSEKVENQVIWGRDLAIKTVTIFDKSFLDNINH
jgi:hypothetical protein